MAGENNVIGLAMQLDVTDLKTGIKEVNQVIKSSKDEFNNATAGMDKWTKSSEGLNAKLKQLGTQLDGQQKIAAGYEAEIKRVSEMEGDHSAQLEVLKGKLLNAQTAVKKTQSAMSHYQDTLKDVTAKEKEENSTLGKLQKTLTDQKNKQAELTKEYKNAVLQYGKNSNEAKDLAKQLQTLSNEIEDNEKEVAKADKAFEGLGKSLDQVAGKALEKSIKTFAKVGAAVGGLVGSFLATAEGTRELRTNMGKVDTAFSEAGFSAEQAEDTYTKFYGILGDDGQTTEAVSHLAKLATSQEDLSKWTDIAAGVYGTFGDSLPIENLTEAANETAKTGELTGGLADALNWAGISEDKFQDKLDACNTEQERQALIQDTLTKAYSGASAKYKETNADIIAGQEAQARLSQAMADVGAQAEPLMTSLKTIGAELLEKLAPAIEKLIPFIQDHLPELAVALGTVTAALGAMGAAVLAVKIKEAALTTATVAHTVATKAQEVAIKGATLAQKALNVVLKANPIGIVITLVLALVTAFVTLWKKSDAFRNFWKGLWDGIKKVAKVAVDAISKFFSACWDGIKKAWGATSKFFKGVFEGVVKVFKGMPDALGKLFSNAWDAIKKAFSAYLKFYKGIFDGIVKVFSTIGTTLGKLFSGAWDKIKSAFSKVTSFFSDVAGDVVDGFKSLPDKMKTVGKNLIEGLWNGVKNMASWISGKLKGFADNVLDGIKNFFGVHSPSTKMAEIGGYMAEGLANGIEDGTNDVVKAGEKIGSGFGEGFNNAAGASVKVDDTFGKLTNTIEKQKNKLSNLESQYKSAVMTFGESSKEAFAFGKQIVTLSREIEANELKVKDLDDSYQNLNSTLANQMRIELNNAKNAQKALMEQAEELRKKQAEAGKAGFISDAAEYGRQLMALNKDLSVTNSTIKELTDNLDYMSEVEKKKAASTKSATSDVVKEKNAYEQLLDTIKTQKEKLEELKKEYENAVLVFGANSDEANSFATEIKDLTKELEENEKQVEELDKALSDLEAKSPTVEVKVDSGKTKKSISEISQILDQVTGYVGKMTNLLVDYIDIDSEQLIDALDKEFETFKNSSDEKLKLIEEQKDAELAAIEETTNAELAALKEKQNARLETSKQSSDKEVEDRTNSINEQLANLNELYDTESISSEEYRRRKRELEEEITNFVKQKEDEQLNYEKRVNDETLAEETRLNNDLAAKKKELEDAKLKAEEETRKAQEEAEAEALRKKNEIAQKQFTAQQHNAILQATIDGATAIVKGFAELGPIGGAVNAVAQGALTAAQIAVITKQKFVPYMAKGGIVDNATLAMIGENGREAVMPLEKNTGWINELAAKLNDIMRKDLLGGLQFGVPAYAMAGGAQVVNNNYYQTINSPKALTRREIYRDSKNLLALKG